MFEIKVNGKQSESYLVVAKDGGKLEAQIKCRGLDLIMLLSYLFQSVSDVIKIPMEDLTCIINKAPKISTTMSINMDQIMKMFGKDR